MSKDLSKYISTEYHPYKAFLVHKTEDHSDVYIESYDINSNGKPINAHPLSVQECTELSLCLQSGELSNDFLTPNDLIPDNVLKINTQPHHSYVIWYTHPSTAQINFVDQLEIPSGQANVPGLIWKAGKDYLSVYALNLKLKAKPNLSTPLYQAPFFNIYESSELRYGNVCMGNVDLDFVNISSLEEFILGWEKAFWNSKFSHMNRSVSPLNSNIVEFWKKHVGKKYPFPAHELKLENLTLRDIAN